MAKTTTKKRSRNLWQTLKARKSFSFKASCKSSNGSPITDTITVLGRYDDSEDEYQVLFATTKGEIYTTYVEVGHVHDKFDQGYIPRNFNRQHFCNPFLTIPKIDRVAGIISANNIPILNADEEIIEDLSRINLKRYALVSFSAVQNLWDISVEKQAHQLLANCTIVHTTQDQSVKTNSRTSIKRIKELFKQGYSIIINGNLVNSHTRDMDDKDVFASIHDHIKKRCPTFHKTGMTLMKHQDDLAIFGFDDNQYFGCLLPPGCNPKTVTSALDCLRPKEIGGHYQRQGEWFVQPVSENIHYWNYTGSTMQGVKLPDENKKSAFDARLLSGFLPRDDADSNMHNFTTERIIINEDGSFLFQNLTLEHSEHPPIRMKGWCKVVKNLAIRSVSANGVD